MRGYLAQFRNIHIVGAAYNRCTGCSETVGYPSMPFLSGFQERSSHSFILQVVKAYESEGFDMLLRAFNDQKYLETLTGLDKLYDEGEAALEAVNWDEEGEDDF
jgi:ubiquitin-like modifier-activating enzyme ATG7